MESLLDRDYQNPSTFTKAVRKLRGIIEDSFEGVIMILGDLAALIFDLGVVAYEFIKKVGRL